MGLKVEKASRVNNKPAPRILNIHELAKGGFAIPSLKGLYAIMQIGDEMKAIGIEDSPIGRLREKYNNSALPQVGDIFVQIEANRAPGSRTSSPRDMSKKWQAYFNKFMEGVLNAFYEEVFPKHAHFIIQDSPVVPMPVPYMEVYIKSQYGNDGNLFAYFEEGDLPSSTVIKGSEF